MDRSQSRFTLLDGLYKGAVPNVKDLDGTASVVPFSLPDLTQAEIDAVCAVLRSGWITTGQETARFERALAAFCQADRAVCLSSQTAAAELVLRLLEIGPGDEVLVPAYTYTATASVVCHVGAKPILIDCTPGQYQMDESKLEAAINPRTKAIIAVDFAGIPCDYRRLFSLAEAKRALFSPSSPLQESLSRIAILADAAHSLGAIRENIPSGAMADFSCLSFHAVKNLTTAEGGAVVWREQPGIDSTELERRLRLLSLHGQSKTALEKQTGGWEYDVLFPGYKCNMTDIAAAIGRSQLARYPTMQQIRRQRIEQYDAALADWPMTLPAHFGKDYCSSAHLYPVRVDGLDEPGRNRLIAQMARNGITCNVHYKPLPMLTAYRSLGYTIEEFPNAYDTYQNEITLPLFSTMTETQVEQVISALRTLL